jgi:hypothetical protein
MRAAPLTAARDTDIDRRFLNPFELQASIERRASAVIMHGRLSIRLLEQSLHSLLRRALTNNDKIPWLHKPDRSGMMRRGQNPRKHLVRNRFS